MADKFRNKYDTVSKSETAREFKKNCLIFYVSKIIPPSINGEKKKIQSIIICFPKINTLEIKNAFKKLFLKKYVDALNKENENYKIQMISPLHNLPVKYWTPYILYKDPSATQLPVTFVNLNENGISYNKFDVCIIS